MITAQITYTEAGDIFTHAVPHSVSLCNLTLYQIHNQKKKDAFQGGYYKTDVILSGKYRGEDFSYTARIDVDSEKHETIQDHIKTYAKRLFKNRHTPFVKQYGLNLLKGQIIALRLLKQA